MTNKIGLWLLLIVLDCGRGDFESSFQAIRVRNSPTDQKRAADDAAVRILGAEKASLFDVQISDNGIRDGFTLIKGVRDDRVTVIGRNAVSALWGVHYYLKTYCNCHISWDGDQVEIPYLPTVNTTVNTVDKVRYYQNVCTSSYSFVWWDWARWEREIDWMAVNGINLALAFTGQEAIWQRTYHGLGLPHSEFTGPAFLAWNRMGNMRNYSYGLNSNWHSQQVDLQHRILKRMRDLGITPVLPAFCGVVPRSFKKVFPLANLTRIPKWNKFSDDQCCPYLLDPNDPLFPVVGRVFLREYISEFGTDHIYNCDMFNENMPASGDHNYLSEMSAAVYREITRVDMDAVWLVQGWMFMEPFWADAARVKAFVTGVPIGKMLILDLQSDLTPQYKRLDSYFGQPFIWCTLHNFGGQLGMYGHLERINVGIPSGRNLNNSTMVGVGIAPEGIDQNYVVYEFTLDGALRRDPVDLADWVSRYAVRRYGKYDSDLRQAWLLLLDSVYNYRPDGNFRLTTGGVKPYRLVGGEHISKNILTRMPSLRMNEPVWYNRTVVYDVYRKFLSAADNVRSSALYQHDLIDVTRQLIQTAVSALYFKTIRDYANVDVDRFRATADTFLDILADLDRILGTGRKYLLGTWLESAKKCSTNDHEAKAYEYNARNQITLWGPNGEIRDYAAKQWSGLVSDYYSPRWRVFMDALNESLRLKTPYNSTAVKELIFTRVERPFGWSRKKYPTTPVGDTVDTVLEFDKKWRDKLERIFNDLVVPVPEVRDPSAEVPGTGNLG